MNKSKKISVEVRNLDLHFGSVEVLKDLNLQIGEGEFLVLLGSSGCGKSTLLNCIAGLLDVTDGQVHINGQNVTWSEPSERGIGMVFQSYALYPQMTVEGNLSFGLKNAKLPKDEIRRRVDRAARILQIEPLLKRKPAALSGGQRQRVAIGRALVRDVDVFLFDEPLSNLDAKLRTGLRAEIKELHQQLENTMIYVTHDQVEAMTLADRIAVMRDGKIMQIASPDDIYSRPVHRYVAEFIGSPSMNFIDGTISKGKFSSDIGSFALSKYVFERKGYEGAVTFGIRPEHIKTKGAAASMPFKASSKVELVEPLGADTLALVSVGKHRLWVRMDGLVKLNPGDKLPIGFSPASANIFDAKTEERV